MGGRREEALLLLLVLAAPFLSLSVHIVGAEGAYTAALSMLPWGIRVCKPAVLDLRPLRMGASSVAAYLVTGSGVLPLPSLPYPLVVSRYGPVTLGYLYNGRPLGSLSARALKSISNELMSPGAAKKLWNVLRPVRWSRLVTGYGEGSDRLLVLLPCGFSARVSRSFAEEVARRLGAIAVYSTRSGYVVLLPRGGEELPVLPDASQQDIGVFIAGHGGAPRGFVLRYNISVSVLSNKRLETYRPISVEPGTQNRERLSLLGASGSNHVWDILPWVSSRFTHNGPYLGRLEGVSGVSVTGQSWSASDSFYIPPYTDRYEVYFVVTARSGCGAHIVVKLDGVTVFDNDYWLSGGSRLVLGVVAIPSQPGYFDAWSKVSYEVHIEALSNNLDLVVKAVPIARSSIASDSPGNLVYTWKEYIAGIEPGQDYGVVEEPPIRIGTGNYTFLLKPPLAYVEDTAIFGITVYGPSNRQGPAHVDISVDGVELCNGFTSTQYYKGATRQVYSCTSSSSQLNEAIINAIREGEPLLLRLSISSSQPSWFIDYGVVLSAERRARAYHTGQYLYQAVASYDIGDELYQSIIATPANILYYAIGVYNDPIPVAETVVRIAGTRPIRSHGTTIGPLGYLVTAIINSEVPTQYYGLLRVKAHGLIESLSVATEETSLSTWGATANRIGRGGISDNSAAYEVASITSYLAGVVSLLLSGGSATLFGIYSVVAGLPATLYESEHLSAHTDYAGDKLIVARAEWGAGVSEGDQVAGVLLDANVVPASLWLDSPLVSMGSTVELTVYSYADSAYTLDKAYDYSELYMAMMGG